MLAHFLVGPDDIRIMGGNAETDGTCTDFVVRLQEGEPFKNLQFADLKAAGGGTIYVDIENQTAEILKPGDPRLKIEASAQGTPLQKLNVI